ncbi:hypothetical protein SAMN05444714_1611 [Yoonia litorea]|uniref:Uncharacterized protein n=1 Tax=Yoonia litorea TaxID=1123755 RepID=A0A1I6MDQ5_9RHOB|nr:hypothetical protein SAMN05444714_1611 [Yoonia litorea]
MQAQMGIPEVESPSCRDYGTMAPGTEPFKNERFWSRRSE